MLQNKIIHFDEIDSTSAYLKRAFENLDNLTIAETDYQSAGKGRENRKWYSPKGENAMFSILIKDKDLIDRFHKLSLLSCLVVRNYLEMVGVKNAKVKWPNDVYVNDKKVCGILLEGRIPDYVIIGIGINLNQTEFNDEYRILPTSAALELGHKLEKQAFLEGLWELLLNSLCELKTNSNDVINEFNKYNYLLDKEVKFTQNDTQYKGVVVGINKDGLLQVKVGDQIFEIYSGEVDK